MFFFLFSHKVQAQYNYQTNRITTDIGKAKKKNYYSISGTTRQYKVYERRRKTQPCRSISFFFIISCLVVIFFSFFLHLPVAWFLDLTPVWTVCTFQILHTNTKMVIFGQWFFFYFFFFVDSSKWWLWWWWWWSTGYHYRFNNRNVIRKKSCTNHKK